MPQHEDPLETRFQSPNRLSDFNGFENKAGMIVKFKLRAFDDIPSRISADDIPPGDYWVYCFGRETARSFCEFYGKKSAARAKASNDLYSPTSEVSHVLTQTSRGKTDSLIFDPHRREFLRVTPADDNQWRVGEGKGSRLFDKKSEAVAYGRNRAVRHGYDELHILNRDWSVQGKWTNKYLQKPVEDWDPWNANVWRLPNK